MIASDSIEVQKNFQPDSWDVTRDARDMGERRDPKYAVQGSKLQTPRTIVRPVCPARCGLRLGRLDEAIGCQHAMQRLCDGAAIGRLLSEHDYEVFIVDQNR